MTEWTFAQQDAAEQLCKLHHFSVKKGEVEFIITVKEYITPPEPMMKFFAQSDKQTNQKLAPYTPMGWGTTLLVALSECMKAIHKFPYDV